MPTNDRVRSAVVELSDQLVNLGFDVTEAIGPINNEGEEIDTDTADAETVMNYYLVAEGAGPGFYIALGTNREYAEVVYQMDVLNHLANYLEGPDVEAILDDEYEWDDMEPAETGQVVREAVARIVGASDARTVNNAAFNLSAYASSSVVDFNQTPIHDVFPAKFQSVNTLFPFTEQMSLKNVDESVHPVIIAGERGRRYVAYSFYIDNDADDPSEYEFEMAF